MIAVDKVPCVDRDGPLSLEPTSLNSGIRRRSVVCMPPRRGSLKRDVEFPPSDQVQVTVHTAKAGGLLFSLPTGGLRRERGRPHDRANGGAQPPAPPAPAHPAGPRRRARHRRRRGGRGDGRRHARDHGRHGRGRALQARMGARRACVGRKALSVNLSDIAAMGGGAQYATISLCLPRDLPLAFVDGLYDGLLERAAEAGVEIVGGNVAAAPVLVIDVTLLGSAERILRRRGAEPGDLVVVTGLLGARRGGPALPGARCAPRRRRGRSRRTAACRPSRRASCATACARSSTRRRRCRSAARSASRIWCTRPWTSRTACRATSPGCARRARSRPGSTPRPCPSTPPPRGSRRRAGTTGSRWPSTAARTTSCSWRCRRRPSTASRTSRPSGTCRSPWWASSRPGRPAVSVKFGDHLRRLRPGAHDHFADTVREERRDPLRGA